MDATIKMMIQGYFDGLDSMKTSDPALKKDVEDFKKELTDFANSQSDPMSFFPKFQESGMMGKYMDLTTKLSMAAQAQAQAQAPAQTQPQQQEAQQAKHRPTPQEWLEPLRTAYNYIKDLPIRERGLKVYRKLFEIGERHTDVTEFLAEVEEENILWKLTSEDTLGILEITLTGMDPLYKGLTYPTLKNIEAWEASVCEADAYYLQELLAAEIAITPPRLLQPEHYVICLGVHLMTYRGPHGKEGIMQMIATGNCYEADFKANARNMILSKQHTRRTLEIMRKAIGMSFEDVLADEYLRYKLLVTSNVCGLSKAYVMSNPVILDILADAYYNEIVPDLPLMDAIKREPSVKLGRWVMPESPEHEKAKAIAREHYKDVPYFKYEDQLQGSIHVGTGEGFDIKLQK